MGVRPTRTELEARVRDGSYGAFVRGEMKDFCFTIDRHEGKDRVWFGSHTVSVNRNLAFNFFDRDPRDDKGLEPFPVVRGERSETPDVRVRPYEDDPSSEYVVPMFVVPRADYDACVRSMEEILGEYEGMRTLPDVYFAESPVVALLRDRLLKHPAVQAERASDWPSFLR